jgi:hypothetical protein
MLHGPDSPRASLAARIWRRTRRESVGSLERIYFYLYVLPRLWRKGMLSLPFTTFRGHGAFVLVSQDAAIKVALNTRSTLRLEYENFYRLKQCGSQVAALMPAYRFVHGWQLAALQCERLTPVPLEQVLPLAVQARRVLDAAVCAGGRLSLDQCTEVLAGLCRVEETFGAAIAANMRMLVWTFLAEGVYRAGLAHGDFHSRNVMIDRVGNCKLIDLDCVRFNGVTEFDALYFALELEWSASGILWTETLARCFGSKGQVIFASLEAFGVSWTDGLGCAFFLDRIGQDEVNFGLHYTPAQMEPVVQAMQSPAPT